MLEVNLICSIWVLIYYGRLWPVNLFAERVRGITAEGIQQVKPIPQLPQPGSDIQN